MIAGEVPALQERAIVFELEPVSAAEDAVRALAAAEEAAEDEGTIFLCTSCICVILSTTNVHMMNVFLYALQKSSGRMRTSWRGAQPRA